MKNNLIHTIELRKPDYSFSVLNWILIIGAIVLFGNKLEAQEQSSVDPDATTPVVKMLLAPPNEHKLHVYVNDEKFIYWPQDKPIFFWLGTSSDEKAQLFPLIHSGSMNSEEWKTTKVTVLNWKSAVISLFAGCITTTKKKQRCVSSLTELLQKVSCNLPQKND